MGVLDGRVALVSGGARGMGEAHVRRFVAEGAQVVFGDVLTAEADALAKELGDAAHAVPLDVTIEEHWAGAVAYAKSELGGLDVLVNNAGIGAGTPIIGGPLDDYMRVIMINQVGVWLGMQHAAPVMAESGGGSIVNISSILGFVGFAQSCAYVAAKHGVIGLTQNAALEYAAQGVRVNSVHPGFIDTPLVAAAGMEKGTETWDFIASKHAMNRWGTVEEVSETVLWLLTDKASFVTGSQYVVDGGYLAQ